MERGSPVKLLMRTARGRTAEAPRWSSPASWVGGGVVTIGTFFLHPAAEIINAAANTAYTNLVDTSVLERLRIVFLSRILDLVYRVRPYRLSVISEVVNFCLLVPSASMV